MLRPNKALHIEQEVLQRYFMKRMEITPELSTGFLNDVLAQDGSCLQKSAVSSRKRRIWSLLI